MSTGKSYTLRSSSSSPVRSGNSVSLPPGTTGITIDPPVGTTDYHVVLHARDTYGARVELADATNLTLYDFDVVNSTPDTLTLDWELFIP